MSDDSESGALPIHRAIGENTGRIMVLEKRIDAHELSLSVAITQLERSARRFDDATLHITHWREATIVLEKKIDLLTTEVQTDRVRRAKLSGRNELVDTFMDRFGWKAILLLVGGGIGALAHWIGAR